MVTNGYKWLQMVTNGYKWLQMVGMLGAELSQKLEFTVATCLSEEKVWRPTGAYF